LDQFAGIVPPARTGWISSDYAGAASAADGGYREGAKWPSPARAEEISKNAQKTGHLTIKAVVFVGAVGYFVTTTGKLIFLHTLRHLESWLHPQRSGGIPIWRKRKRKRKKPS
jgi:hypothetical protein